MAEFTIIFTKTVSKKVIVKATKAEIIEEMGLEDPEDKRNWREFAMEYFEGAMDLEELAKESDSNWDDVDDLSYEINE